jgi:hypothetical protein
MKRSAKYVGCDVHQATIVATVRDDAGRVVARSVMPTEAAAILGYLRGMRGAIHVAFEEGTQAQWLYELVRPVVEEVVVCDRRGQVGHGNKGDHHDADELADLLWRGKLRIVYHDRGERAALRELTRTYDNLVQDTTRVMLRLKALFRARGIRTPGQRVYGTAERAQWLAQLPNTGVRFRARALYTELDVLRALRAEARAAMIAEAKRDPAWRVLRQIPFLGDVRVAHLLATLQTPWRFRTKRALWAYAGLAVVTRTSAEYQLEGQRPVRRRQAPRTRGLNRNHNPVVKNVLKAAAAAAIARTGAFQTFYYQLLARGMREELARVTLARKVAAVILHLWKTGDHYDPAQLSVPSGHRVPAR